MVVWRGKPRCLWTALVAWGYTAGYSYGSVAWALPLDIVMALWHRDIPLDIVMALWHRAIPLDIVMALWHGAIPMDIVTDTLVVWGHTDGYSHRHTCGMGLYRWI